MGSKTLPVLLVTANVGSIFEDPIVMLKIWTDEFLSTVARLDPKFIAIHCQEVGGKNYEKSMKHVEDFVRLLMSSDELRLFDKVRVFLDEDYSSAENFTALGNFYFVHESINDALIWNFKELKFVPAAGKEIHSGNIEAVITKEKAKFPQDFFPECKWSRKGFLRTRWMVKGTVFDLINIHLFHDASNFIAMETFPSIYVKNRRRALEHTLQKFHNDANGSVPYFLFGDFNFRTDTDGVVKKLTEGLKTTKIQNNKNNEYTKLQYSNESSQAVLTVGKKEFNHSDHQQVFLNNDCWLRSYDRELEAFESHLTEYPISFQPSYPFEENISYATSYMRTRCPSWCDRVLLSHAAKSLVCEEAKMEYGLMGKQTCMGDHKPVYLRLDLQGDSGIVQCCKDSEHVCLPAVTCQCCQPYASVTINIVDMNPTSSDVPVIANIDRQFLHEPIITKDMLLHEPYTPESAESRSPCPEPDAALSGRAKVCVSPTMLKSRLEMILNQEPILKNYNKTPIKRCFSEDVHVMETHKQFYRERCMTDLSRKFSRARLISTDSAQSALRLQSHHSSSDEDWFEFDDDDADDDDGHAKSKKSSVAPNNDGVRLPDDLQLANMNGVKKRKRTCCNLS